jgi:Tol biopolymer transport system component
VPGGHTLVLSAAEQGKTNLQLWRVDLTGGVVTTILSDLSSTLSIVDRPGGAVVPLTGGRGRYDGQPGLVWTPDGRLIFSSAAGGQNHLWIMDGNGQNARQLTSDLSSETQPTVTPDDRWAVFNATRRGTPGLWNLRLDNGSVQQLTDGRSDFYPQALPDNQSIIFTRVSSDGSYRPYRVSVFQSCCNSLPTAGR